MLGPPGKPRKGRYVWRGLSRSCCLSWVSKSTFITSAAAEITDILTNFAIVERFRRLISLCRYPTTGLTCWKSVLKVFSDCRMNDRNLNTSTTTGSRRFSEERATLFPSRHPRGLRSMLQGLAIVVRSGQHRSGETASGLNRT
ncbi:hypothetical protein DPMN_086855 [Dreissena polymorpha]|uniref:Uncharacterized protein n=1 Tax=Dreissena polymorpha TaxID=45954 RepID=A0A9D4KRN0_DREPO|nr:hypothetical protein DPMN_086855 [Dreissena polymorpha]